MRESWWLAASVSLPALILGGAMAASPGVQYNRWDNLELLLPAIWFNHTQLLHGEFPHWNQFQNMGQPAHAQGIGGALYPGYTLAAFAAKYFGQGPRSLLSIIAVSHAMLACCACFLLLRHLTVRPSLALVGSLSIVMCGPVLYLSSVWIWVAPYQAWSAIALLAVLRIVDQPRRFRWVVLCAVALSMFFHIGHGQWAAYCCVATGLVAVGYALVQRGLRAAAMPLLIALVAGALLAMPSILPTTDLIAGSDRAADLSPAEFSYRGVTREALLGLFLPILRGRDGFSGEGSLYTMSVGVWVLPAVFVMLAESLRRKRDHLSALSLLFAGIGLFLLLLSMGEQGGLYPWTYGLPIWSRFRWPFKLLPRAAPLLIIAASIAAELLARRAPSRQRGAAVFICIALLLALWGWHPSVADTAAICAAIVGLAAVVLLLCIHLPIARAAFLALIVLSSIAMLLQTHHPGRFKAYEGEIFDRWNANAFDIDLNYRVLPLSHALPSRPIFQEAALFDAATLNGYFSLTGTHTHLSSRILSSYLPVTTEGTLERSFVGPLVHSHLLRTCNVRYFIALNEDQPICNLLDQMNDVTEHKRTAEARIYQYRDPMPRAWFASEVRPADDDSMVDGLIGNEAPRDCAFVYADIAAGPTPPASVLHAAWGHNRIIIDTDAPDGGFLVVAMTRDHHWRATVDGREVQPLRVNGAITGLPLPAGALRVEMRYDAAPLRSGLIVAVGGIVLLIVAGVRRASTSRASRAEVLASPGGP